MAEAEGIGARRLGGQQAQVAHGVVPKLAQAGRQPVRHAALRVGGPVGVGRVVKVDGVIQVVRVIPGHLHLASVLGGQRRAALAGLQPLRQGLAEQRGQQRALGGPGRRRVSLPGVVVQQRVAVGIREQGRVVVEQRVHRLLCAGLEPQLAHQCLAQQPGIERGAVGDQAAAGLPQRALAVGVEGYAAKFSGLRVVGQGLQQRGGGGAARAEAALHITVNVGVVPVQHVHRQGLAAVRTLQKGVEAMLAACAQQWW